MYRTARSRLATTAYLKKKNATNAERLQEAMRVAENGELLEKRVNKTTFRFLISQIQMQQKEPKGRRYGIDDKVFALSILKQSPKSYKLLSKVFALPSRMTLLNLLSKIPFGCGLSKAIMDSLQESTSKMSSSDKYSTLLFDEMSVEAALSYNTKADYIDGFQHCAGDTKKSEFADHVMVFMARGIFKKWPLPISIPRVV